MADTDAIMDGEDNPTSDTRPTCREKSEEAHKKPDIIDLLVEVRGSDMKTAVNFLDIDINDQNAAKVNIALIHTCLKGNCEVVRSLLIEKKANIEHRTKSGHTPLMIAAISGDINLGNVLLRGSAFINATYESQHGNICTSLSFAANGGHLKFVNLLLALDPDVDIKGGTSPLLLACDAGHLDVVKCLLQNTNYLPSDKDLQDRIAVNKEQSDEIKREKCKKCIDEIINKKKRSRDDTATGVQETHNLDGRNESSAKNAYGPSELVPPNINCKIGNIDVKQKQQPILLTVIIDGSNVAFSHGKNEKFSWKGIEITADFFLKRGHKVYVILPGKRKRDCKNIISDREKIIVFAQRGSYDDRWALSLAEEKDAIILTNDKYRDLIDEKESWKKIIKERLLTFRFVDDQFIPTPDPLGRNGPFLDEFLQQRADPLPSTTSKS